MKFSIASLLFVVLVTALGCAALVNVTELWRQTMVSLTVIALMIATIAFAVDRSRSFAMGFATAGWIYFVLSFTPSLGVRDALVTTQTVRWGLKTIHGDDFPTSSPQSTAFAPDGRTIASAGRGGMVRVWDVTTGALVRTSGDVTAIMRQSFADIGHALWTLIIALLGGVVGILFARGRENPGP